MRLATIGVVLAAVSAALVSTASPAQAVPAVQGGGGPVAVNQRVTLTLTLTAAEPSAVQAYATAVSTPGSSAFGHRLTRKQVRESFGAPSNRVSRVTAWASRAGFSVEGLDDTGTQLTLSGTARTVRAALGVALTRTDRRGVRALTANRPATLPATVASDVQAVTGLTQRVAQPMIATPAVNPSPAADGQYCARWWGEWNNAQVPQKYPAGKQSNPICGYSGPQLRAMYGLGSADRGQGQTIVIVGAYHQASALADANRTFAANGVPTLPSARFVVKTYAPPTNVSGCDLAGWHAEEALDIQAAHTIAPDARIVVAAAPDCTQLEGTLAKVVADPSIDTTIISASWGLPAEPDDSAYLGATNGLFARAAMLGIGIYASSGDAGDNSNVPGAAGPSVVYPASSPWITAVGGTSTAVTANNTVAFTTGWANAGNRRQGTTWQRLSPPFIGGAGGGSSAHFDKPSWQTGTPGSRRSVPDIAALADPYTGLLVGWSADGQYGTRPLGGTSLAAPIVASLAAVAQGRAGNGTDIGFAAPILYAKAGGGRIVTDVTHVAAGVWTPGISADQPRGDYLVDFDADVQSLKTGPGYDTVTGLGTPGPGYLTELVS